MKYARLSSGQQFPLLGLGTWKSPEEEVYKAVRKAIEIGYRHIDCASIYLNETVIGKALSDAISAGEVVREELWVTSKLWNSDHAPEDVESACKKTLADLKLDYLDLYLIHWPVAQKHSVGLSVPHHAEGLIALDDLPLATTWQAMEKLVDKKLTQSIGVSNFSIKKLQDLLSKSRIKPAINQVESHPFLSQQKLLTFCQDNHVVLTAYSPLGSGDRPAGAKAHDEPSLLQNPVINEIAKTHQAKPAQILIAWQLDRGVAVIPKSVNPARLKENFDSIHVKLTPDEQQAIEKLDRHYRFIKGDLFTVQGSSYSIETLWDE